MKKQDLLELLNEPYIMENNIKEVAINFQKNLSKKITYNVDSSNSIMAQIVEKSGLCLFDIYNRQAVLNFANVLSGDTHKIFIDDYPENLTFFLRVRDRSHIITTDEITGDEENPMVLEGTSDFFDYLEEGDEIDLLIKTGLKESDIIIDNDLTLIKKIFNEEICNSINYHFEVYEKYEKTISNYINFPGTDLLQKSCFSEKFDSVLSLIRNTTNFLLVLGWVPEIFLSLYEDDKKLLYNLKEINKIILEKIYFFYTKEDNMFDLLKINDLNLYSEVVLFEWLSPQEQVNLFFKIKEYRNRVKKLTT